MGRRRQLRGMEALPEGDEKKVINKREKRGRGTSKQSSPKKWRRKKKKGGTRRRLRDKKEGPRGE